MTRSHLLLLVVLIGCALSVITCRFESRKRYGELQKEQRFAHELDVEYGRLRLEQGTWAAHALIERRATDALGMHMPDTREVQVITLGSRP